MRNKYINHFLLVVLFMCCSCSSTNNEVTTINDSKVDKNIWGYYKTYETLDTPYRTMTNGFDTKNGYYFIEKFENTDQTFIGKAFVQYDENKQQFNLINDDQTKNCNFGNPENCSSFVDDSSEFFNYYNDKIYITSSSHDFDTDMITYEIYEMDMNGSQRKQVFSKSIESNTTYFVPYFTNGYMFYTNDREIGIVDLDTWEWTSIVDQENASFSGLMCVDGELYINATHYQDDKKMYPNAVFKIDYENKKLIHVLDSEGDVLFYQKSFTIQMIDEKTYYVDTQTGNKTKFSDSWGYVFYDQENELYLYSDLFEDETGIKKYILFKSDGTILDTFMRDKADGLGEIFDNNSFIFAKNEYVEDGSIAGLEFYKMNIVDGKFADSYQLGDFGN